MNPSRTSRFVVLAALALALLSGVGCAGPAAPKSALVGPSWLAEDIGGRGVIDDLQSRIAFTAAGRAEGTGGCNRFTGGYEVEGGSLAIGPLASTRMACPPAIMDQEGRFHDALAATRGYRIEQGLLYLLDDQGRPLMRLAPGE